MGPRDFSVYDGDENSSNAETNEVDSNTQNSSAENEESQTPISEEEANTLLKDKRKDDENNPPCYPGLPHYLVPWSVQCEINPNLPEILRRNREEAKRNRKEREAQMYREAREEAERNRKEHEEVEEFRKEREEAERNRRKLEASRNELNSEAPSLPQRSQKLMKASTVSNPRVGQVRARVSPKTVRFANQRSDIQSSSSRWDYNYIIFVCLFVGCTAIVVLLAAVVIILAVKL